MDSRIALQLNLDTRDFTKQSNRANQLLKNIQENAQIELDTQSVSSTVKPAVASQNLSQGYSIQSSNNRLDYQAQKAQEALLKQQQKTLEELRATVVKLATVEQISGTEFNKYLRKNSEGKDDLGAKAVVYALNAMQAERKAQKRAMAKGESFSLNPFKTIFKTMQGAMQGFREGLGQRAAARAFDIYTGAYENKLGISFDKIIKALADVSAGITNSVGRGLASRGIFAQLPRIKRQVGLIGENVFGYERVKARGKRDERGKLITERQEDGTYTVPQESYTAKKEGFVSSKASDNQNLIIQAVVSELSKSVANLLFKSKNDNVDDLMDVVGDNLAALGNSIGNYRKLFDKGYEKFQKSQVERAVPIAERRAENLLGGKSRANAAQYDSKGKPIVTAVGGYGARGGETSETIVAATLNRAIKKPALIQSVQNTYSDKSAPPSDDPNSLNNVVNNLTGFNASWVAGVVENIISDIVAGVNFDAVELAATQIASRKVNPNAPIAGIGYSQGGNIQLNATAITNAYDKGKQEGEKVNIRSVGIGTPSPDNPRQPANHRNIIPLSDTINGTLTNPLGSESRGKRPDQNIDDKSVTDHRLSTYLNSELVAKEIQEAIGKSIKLGKDKESKRKVKNESNYREVDSSKPAFGGFGTDRNLDKNFIKQLLVRKDEGGKDLFAKEDLAKILQQLKGEPVAPNLSKGKVIQELTDFPLLDIVDKVQGLLNGLSFDEVKDINILSPLQKDAADLKSEYNRIMQVIRQSSEETKRLGLNEKQAYNYVVAHYTLLRAKHNQLKAILTTTQDLNLADKKALSKVETSYSNTLNTKGSKVTNPDGSISKVSKAESDIRKIQQSATNPEELGHDLSAGYALGIDNDSTVEAATKLAEDALEAIRATQDSHSPSKESEKLGIDNAAGYALGLAGSGKLIEVKAGGMVDSAMRAIMKKYPDLYQIAKHGNNYLGAMFNEKTIKSAKSGDVKGAVQNAKGGVEAYTESQYQRAARIAVKRAERNQYYGNDKPEGITFFSAGLAGQKGKSWGSGRDLREMGKDIKAQQVDNKTTDVPDLAKHAAFRSLLNKFRIINMDSIEMAAKALVASRKNAEVEISAIGHSYGSHVVDVFGGIVKRLGLKARTLGFGQPMGTVNPDSHEGTMGSKDALVAGTYALGMKPTIKPTGFGAGGGHALPNYAEYVPNSLPSAKGEVLTKDEVREKLLHAIDVAQDIVKKADYASKEDYLKSLKAETIKLMRLSRNEVISRSLDRYKGKNFADATRVNSNTHNIALLEQIGAKFSSSARKVLEATNKGGGSRQVYSNAQKPRPQSENATQSTPPSPPKPPRPKSTSNSPEEPEEPKKTNKQSDDESAKVLDGVEKAAGKVNSSLGRLVGQLKSLILLAKGGNFEKLLAVANSSVLVLLKTLGAVDKKLQGIAAGFKGTKGILDPRLVELSTNSIKSLFTAVNIAGSAFSILDSAIVKVNFKQFFQSILSGSSALEGASRQLVKAGLLLGTAFVGFKFLSFFGGVVKSAASARKEIDDLYVSIRSVQRGTQRDTFLKTQVGLANKAKTDVASYTKLQVGLKATIGRQGVDTDALTAKLTKGLSDRGVSGDASDRFLTGITQMAGKGVVSMEELRQQMGEALPATMSIAADSIGVTTAQFNKLVASGSILSSDFLPAFSEELQITNTSFRSAAQGSAVLNNELLLLKDQIARALPIKTFGAAIVGGIKLIRANFQGLAVIIGTIVVASVAALVAGLKTLIEVSAVASAVAGGFVAALAPATIVIGLISAAVGVFKVSSKSAQKEIYAISDSLQAVIDKNDKLKKGASDKSFANYKGHNAWFNKTNIGAREASRNVEAIEYNVDVIFKQRMKFKSNPLEEADKERASALYKQVSELRAKAANGVSLGLDQDSIIKLGQEADKLQKDFEIELNLKYGIEEKEATLKTAQDVIERINSEVEKGNPLTEALRLQKEDAEKVVAEVKSALLELNKLKLVVQVTPVVAAENLANRESLSFRTTEANLDSQMSLLTQAIQENTTQAGYEAMSRVESINALKRQSALNTKQIESERKVVSSITAVQRGVVKAQTGGIDLEKLDYKGIIALQNKLEANSKAEGSPVDENLAKAIESQKQILELTQQNKQTAIDAGKAELELQFTIKNLQLAMKGLVVDMKNKSIEIARFALSASRFKEDKVRPIRLQAESTDYSLKGSIRSTTQAFEAAVKGVRDFAYGIKQSIEDIQTKIRAVDFSIYSDKVSGVGNVLSIQGIEDVVGLGSIRDLITKASNIKANSQTPALTREKENISRSFEIENQGKNKELESLRYDTANQIRDIKNQRQENAFNANRAAADIPLELSELINSRENLVTSIEQLNRTIDENNDQASAYGISERLPKFTQSAPLINESDLVGTQQAVASYYKALDGYYSRAELFLNQIQAKGTANFQAELRQAQTLHQERMKLKDDEIAQSNTNDNAKTEQIRNEVGAFQASAAGKINVKIAEVEAATVDVAKTVRDALNTNGNQLTKADITAIIRETKGKEIQAQIDKFQAVGASIDKLATSGNYDQGGILGTRQLVQQGISAGFVDESLGNAFEQMLVNIEQSGEYEKLKEVFDLYKKAVLKGARELEEGKEKVIEDETQAKLRPGQRALVDARLEKERLEINGDRSLTSTDKAKENARIDFEQGKEAALRGFNDRGDMPIDQATELRDRLLEINQIKYDQAVSSLSTFSQIIESVKAPLEQMFNGIGESIGKTLSRAVDPTEMNNKLNEVNAQFGEQLLELQEKYAEDPEGLREATERLKELNESKLDGISKEFSLLNGVLGSVKTAIGEVLASIAKLLIQKGVEKLLGGVFGGNIFGGLFGGGKGIGVKAEGGTVGFDNKAFGGCVGTYSQGGKVRGLIEALKYERRVSGKKAIPIVAHEGEEVLTTLNGDASLFRRLKQSGYWDELKESKNFFAGGTVGGSQMNSSPYSNSRLGSTNRNTAAVKESKNYTSNFNIQTQNVNDFYRSQSQIGARQQAFLKEAEDRNA